MKLTRITPEKFHALKEGDTIHIKCGKIYYKSVVCGTAFYNSDSDAPEWEIETNNGFADIHSIYLPQSRSPKYPPFINDSEKMVDFLYLSKEDFLKSYSYLTEEEYTATVDAVLKLLYGGEQNAL